MNTCLMREVSITFGVLLILGSTFTLLPNTFGPDDFNVQYRAEQDIRILKKGIELFKVDVGRYPTAEEGLSILWNIDLGRDIEGYHSSGYLLSEVIDPWGRSYHYSLEGVENDAVFDIWSRGKDGLPGGDGDNSDVFNKKTSTSELIN